MSDKVRTIVQCKDCGAHRCIELADECFCGEHEYKVVPPLKLQTVEDTLFGNGRRKKQDG